MEVSGRRRGDVAASQTKARLFVVAIDLGTAYSGWAYSTRDDPLRVEANSNWYAGGTEMATLKTPTCVLLTPDQEFNAFGYEAETTYTSLAEDDEHHGWFFFRRFKMCLYSDQELNTHTEVEDIGGKKLPLITIFTHALKFLKDHFLQTLKDRFTETLLSDITFVVTVPAIWTDVAKTFTRTAAERAGIESEQLIIALEPEAASIWCQNVQTEIQRDDDSPELGISGEGTQYMIVDIGGGTADITVHEKKADDTLREIHKVSGGPWGGDNVDNTFMQLMETIFGSDVMDEFCQNELEDVLELTRNFESKKRLMTTDMTGKITLKVPSSLKDIYENSGHPISDIVKPFAGMIALKSDKMRIDASLIMSCFENCVPNLISLMDNILSDRNMSEVNTIMLVGGMSESKYVQSKLKAYFQNARFIIPSECGLAVVRGAVLFGHKPDAISSRVARYTYGINIAVPFDPRYHPVDKCVETDTGPLCKDHFWKIVEVGQDILIDHEVSREGRAVDDFQREIVLHIYRSTERNPTYTTDDGCRLIVSILIPLETNLLAEENVIDEIFKFGGTEIVFQAVHSKTKKTVGKILNIDV